MAKNDSSQSKEIGQRSTATQDPLFSTTISSLDDVAHELSFLQDLANRGSWNLILEAVSRARSGSLLTAPHDHLTYMAFSALSLTKLRRFKDALAELDSLDDFDSHHYRYETYPKIYPSRSGSMVPFVLRWLHALLPIKLGRNKEGLDRLYLLLGFVRDRISSQEDKTNPSRKIWRQREYLVLSCIIGQHVTSMEFNTCLDVIKEAASRGFCDPFLVGKLGLVQMHMGNLEGAKASFNWVEKLVEEDEEMEGSNVSNLMGRNRALLFVANKDYVSAVREYEGCIERDPLDAVSINNKALCLMYLRDLSDSIKGLEGALERVPTVALKEPLLVNLCSMYELAYVNHSDIKRTLNSWVSKVAPDDFHFP